MRSSTSGSQVFLEDLILNSMKPTGLLVCIFRSFTLVLGAKRVSPITPSPSSFSRFTKLDMLISISPPVDLYVDVFVPRPKPGTKGVRVLVKDVK